VVQASPRSALSGRDVWVFPAALEQARDLQTSECAIQRSVRGQPPCGFPILDRAGDREPVKLGVAISLPLNPSGEDRSFERQEHSRLAARHPPIISRYLPISKKGSGEAPIGTLDPEPDDYGKEKAPLEAKLDAEPPGDPEPTFGDGTSLPGDAPTDLGFGSGAREPVTDGPEANEGLAADLDAPFDPVAGGAPSDFGLDGPLPDGLEPDVLEPAEAGVDPGGVLVDDTADHSDPTDVPIG